MNNIEYKRKELELQRVQMARKEMQFRIDEFEYEIEKLRGYIVIQTTKEEDLKQELIKGKE